MAREDAEGAKSLLFPLVALGEPAAVLLNAQMSHVTEEEDSHLDRLLQAVVYGEQREFPPAMYLMGYYREEGEFGYRPDRILAAELFQRAASLGHEHSQWIHGLDLIQGSNGVSANLERGHMFLIAAANAGLQRALETLSESYRLGSRGFPLDGAVAAQLATKARRARNWI